MRFEDAMYEVLQGRRYDRLMGRTRDIRQIIIDFFERLFEALFNRLNLAFPQGMGEGRVITVIFAVVGGVLLVAGAAVLMRVIWQSRRARKHDLSDIFEELAAHQYTVADLLQLSDGADERRAAVRYRYIATLLALDEADIIRITPSATNALILRGLRRYYPALTGDFMEMANIYHLAWFGYRGIDDAVYMKFCEACDVLMKEKRG